MELRQIILVAIIVLAAYIAYQLYRVSRPKLPETLAPRAKADAAPRAVEPVEPGVDDDEDDDDAPVVFERPRITVPVPAEAPSGDVFQQELEVRQLRRELEQQRGELAELRHIVEELRDTLLAQKEQADASLVTRGASPEYNEALVFARRGLDAEAIAERCGITLAEAELVKSLARGESGGAAS